MLGVFDSGRGGTNLLLRLRQLRPDIDAVFMADEKNAPYGIKEEDEIIRITKENIRTLMELGADRVAIACCTASTVWPRLSELEKNISIPIILPTARAAARAAQGGRIALIATDRTAKSRAFYREIKSLSPDSEIRELGSRELVSLTEAGLSDNRMTPDGRAALCRILSPIISFAPAALILGCTHFDSVAETARELLPSAAIISAAEEGAREIARIYQPL